MGPTLKDLKDLKNVNLDKAKARVDKLVVQAKESIKVLETLQKEGMALAKTLMDTPVSQSTKKVANEKIVKNLSKIGLATREEVRELEKKLETLAGELHTQFNKVKKKVTKDN